LAARLAGRCADVFVGQSAAVAITELRDYFRSKLNFDDARCDGLLTQISRRSSEIAPLFDIHLNTDLAYEEILQRANQSIIQLNLEAQERGPKPRHLSTGDTRTSIDCFHARAI